MAFIVNPVREVTFHHVTKNNDEFSVTFKFLASEDTDFVELRTKLENKMEMDSIDESGKVTKIEVGTYNAFLYTLRKSLAGWNNIADPDGKILEFNENNQIAVFEAIRLIPELLDKITMAYLGHKGKN